MISQLRTVMSDGLDCIWKTNLSDEDLKNICYILTYDCEYIKYSNFNSHLPFRTDLEYNNGFVFVTILHPNGWAIFKTKRDILRDIEIDELNSEIWDKNNARMLLLFTDDRYIIREINNRIAMKKFDDAYDLIELRIYIRNINKDLIKRYIGLFEWNINRECICHLSFFDDFIYGLKFLKKYSNASRDFLQFAESYLYNTLQRNNLFPSLRPQIPEEHELKFANLFFIGLSKVIDKDDLYKKFVLFFERSENYKLAIELCNKAILNGIKDRRKIGFSGMVKRLNRKITLQETCNH